MFRVFSIAFFTICIYFSASERGNFLKGMATDIDIPGYCLAEKNGGKLKISKEVRVRAQQLVDKWASEFFPVSKDCPFPLVQVLAGHKRQETTSKFYTHFGMEKKREGIVILDRYFRE